MHAATVRVHNMTRRSAKIRSVELLPIMIVHMFVHQEQTGKLCTHQTVRCEGNYVKYSNAYIVLHMFLNRDV